MIKSPYDEAEALLTLERDGIIEQKRIKLKGSMHQVELPIDKNFYAPGFFISVVIVKGRTSNKVEGKLDLGKPSFKMGYTKVNVKSKHTHLNVSVKSNQEVYQPRQNVDLEIEVKDFNKVGTNSELAVAVVDEAILSLVADYMDKYKIHDSFYKLETLGVENFQTLVNIIGRQTFGKKGGNTGGGGGNVDTSVLRKDFKAVAYWNPQVMTDDQGKAKINFKAPDNLTGWKIIVVAVDQKHRFGVGNTNFKVNKKLMIEPVLPNFLTEFDRLTARYKIHNMTDKEFDVSFKMESSQFVIPKNEMTKSLSSQGSAFLSLPISSQFPGKYILKTKATGGGFSDSVQSTIPVIPIANNSTQVITGFLEGKKIEQDIKIPQTIRENSHSLKIEYSNNLLNNLIESFNYILKYPYGCWEQRMSKAVFWAIYQGVDKQIGDQIQIDRTKSPDEIVKEFLAMAPKYQSEDGGMKYYPSAKGVTSPYLSIYTAEVFTIMEENGFTPPKKVKTKLIKYLKNILNKDSALPRYYIQSGIQAMRAKIIYILNKWKAGSVDDQIRTYAVKDIQSMSGDTLAYLIKVIRDKSDLAQQFSKISSYLKSKIKRNPQYLSLALNERKTKYDLYTSMRTQCQLFLSLFESKVLTKEEQTKYLEYILRKRRNSRWYNTQENLYCLYSIYQFIKNDKIDLESSVVAKIDNQTIKETKIPKIIKTPLQVKVPQQKIKIGRLHKLSLEPSNNKKIYYSMQVKYTDFALSEKFIDNGFDVKKYMYRLNQKDGLWSPIEGTINLKRGDIVKIVLIVTTDEDRYQVGIHDPLAAGFEPINYNLDTSSILSKVIDNSIIDNRYKAYENQHRSDYFRGKGFHYVDLRLQAAQFYADRLRANTQYHVEYAVSVTSAGKFYMDATRVEEMYYPDVYGLTPAKTIHVSD